MIIDAHAHIFPDKIAQKAVDGIGGFYDMLKMRFDGKLSSLLEIGEKAGMDKYIVQSVATVPAQVVSINTFIADCVAEHPDKLIGFATIHPDFEDVSGELDRAMALGLKGIKIHPDFQRFCIDDEKAIPIYEYAVEHKLPILIHTGDFRYEWSKPSKMAKVLDKYPDLIAIGAHFGGWSEWDDAMNVLTGYKNFYVDTSSSLYSMTPDEARKAIDAFGIDKVFFGTDYPMWNPVDEMELFNKIPLTDDEKELILYKNVERVVGL